MFWKRINAKPLVTILLFKLCDKTCNFAAFAEQYQYPQTSTFRRQNENHLILNLAQD